MAKDGEIIGTTVNERYRIIEKLGQGGMGTVYRGVHIFMERPVAIKVLHAHLVTNNNFIQRFLHEARINSKLTHRNAVVLYDFGVFEKMPYLVFEFVNGKTLREVLLSDGAFNIDRFRNIIMQIGAALGHAHTLGIIHRDLKPDNIMVRSNDSDAPEHACVLDFGIAKAIHHSDEKNKTVVTQMGMVMGTPQYLSPEQALERELDSRSDIYSLGIIMYEMLTGEVPFKSNSSPLEILVQHLNSLPVPIRTLHPEMNIPAGISEPVMRCLQKDPNDRFQSVQDLLTAIELGYQAAKRIAGEEREAAMQSDGMAPPANGVSDPLPTNPEAPIHVPSVSAQEDRTAKFRLLICLLSVVAVAGLYFSLPAQKKSTPTKPALTTETKTTTTPVATNTPAPVIISETKPTEKEPPVEVKVETPTAPPINKLDPTESTLVVNFGQVVPVVLDSVPPSQEVFGAPDLVTEWIRSADSFRAKMPEEVKSIIEKPDVPVIQSEDLPASSSWSDIPLDSRDGGIPASQFGRRLSAAKKLLQQKEYQQAATELQELLKSKGDDLNARFAFANALYRLGERTAAFREFKRVLEIEPEYAPAIYYMAIQHALANEKEAALEKLQSALRLFPGAKKWAETDSEFDSLRNDEDFKKLLSRH